MAELSLSISVFLLISRKKIPGKKPEINSAYHLLHEQHHFDITRLGAERLIEELAKAEFTEENYRSMLNSIFEKTYRENNQLQLQYDGETSHSLNTEKQKEWNDRIATAMKKLESQLAAAK
jgi:predicted secreted Zn-dependent protease